LLRSALHPTGTFAHFPRESGGCVLGHVPPGSGTALDGPVSGIGLMIAVGPAISQATWDLDGHVIFHPQVEGGHARLVDIVGRVKFDRPSAVLPLQLLPSLKEGLLIIPVRTGRTSTRVLPLRLPPIAGPPRLYLCEQSQAHGHLLELFGSSIPIRAWPSCTSDDPAGFFFCSGYAAIAYDGARLSFRS